MNTRRATDQDAQLLGSLIVHIQKMHADAVPDIFKQPDDPQAFVADFQERILPDEDGHTFIVEDNGTALGYIYTRVIRRPENAYTYAMNFVLIDQIAVLPEHHGKGAGRLLIEAAFDLARREGIDRVTLGTWAFNKPAHGFFAKMGFKHFTYQLDVLLSGEHQSSS